MNAKVKNWLQKSCQLMVREWLVPNLLVFILFVVPTLFAQSGTDTFQQLKEMIEKQQKALEELRVKLEQQQSLLDSLQKQQEELAKEELKAKALAAKPAREMEEKPVAPFRSVAGFKFSGDFLLRVDTIARPASSVLGASHNARGRYRFRFNTDKDINSQLNFHVQLASGPFNNHLTTNQDFTVMTLRNPINLSEAFVDYHPTKDFSLRRRQNGRGVCGQHKIHFR